MLKWLREIRKKAGLKQSEVAKLAGISQEQYSGIETGVRGVRVPTAKKIAVALGFDWQRFYEDAAE